VTRDEKDQQDAGWLAQAVELAVNNVNRGAVHSGL
jgi:hypothetical protein